MKMLRAVLLVLVTGCASDPAQEPSAALLPAPAVDAAAGPPIVVGTVIDARSGEAVAGAAIAGPQGAAAESDADGRFRIKGLPAGASGALTATAGDRTGSVLLRPLSGGRLEVVVYVR